MKNKGGNNKDGLKQFLIVKMYTFNVSSLSQTYLTLNEIATVKGRK